MKIDVNKPLENPKLKQLFAQRRQTDSGSATLCRLRQLCENLCP